MDVAESPEPPMTERSEPPLRVAIEATALLGPRTGIGTMTAAVLSGLAARPDVDVTGLLVSWRGRSDFARAVPAGARARRVGLPARAAHWWWPRVGWPPVGGFDVIHGPNFVVPPTGGGAALVTVHDFGPWRYPELVSPRARRSYPRLVAAELRRGAHVHTGAEFVADEAVELLGVSRDRVHVIPHGFDATVSGDAARGRRLAGSERYVLAVGTIEPRKDHPTLVRAMGQVWSELADLRLVVAGPDGWGTEALEAALDEVGAGDRVLRLGYVSDQERTDLLAGAVCLAFPSRYEGFGLPPLEAMAQDTPVIVTSTGPLPEVCGPAARYVGVGAADELAAAIVEVATDSGLAEQLRMAGRARVREFSWDRTVDELVGLYRRLADRN
jgi:glycosyltransferase involved in cell wall biosynthesis